MASKYAPMFLVAAAAAGLLAGCSSDSDEGSSEGAFPIGAYESTASLNDQGPVTLTYKDDGTRTIEQGGALVVTGTYTVDGDQITLSDPYCKKFEGQESASYTWTWDGSTMAMTTTDDACSSRKAAVAEAAPVE